jgi:UDP-glucose 4-epimerase
VIFRFFNAAGYDDKGRIKRVEQNAANLLPIIMETANKIRKNVEVYGDTHDTADGTGVRDYIHVSDLALAHEKAIDYLSKKNSNLITNLATGKGYSVLEIIKRFEDLISTNIAYDVVKKREGDPASLVASSKIAYEELGWEPHFSKIDIILDSMWNIYKGF